VLKKNQIHIKTCYVIISKISHEPPDSQKATLYWSARRRMNDIQYGVALEKKKLFFSDIFR
jgi:hypothetical protein